MPASSSSKSSSETSSPTTVSSFGEGLRTPPPLHSPLSQPSPRTGRAAEVRSTALRASVFDAFKDLGAFDENSQIAEWIFDTDVDTSTSAFPAPRSSAVRFQEATGSRFKEGLDSDMAGYKLNQFIDADHGPSSAPLRRPTKSNRFFNGLRARSVSRHREDKEKRKTKTGSTVAADEEKDLPSSPVKPKRPLLMFRSKSARTIETSMLAPPLSVHSLSYSGKESGSLDMPRPSFTGKNSMELTPSSSGSPSLELSPASAVKPISHASNPSVTTNSSWVNVRGTASMDLLRNTDAPHINPFLRGRGAGPSPSPGAGVPFPQTKERGGAQLFRKISTAVSRPFLISDSGSRSRSGRDSPLPIRRTQSRPPEATEARMAPLRTPSAFSADNNRDARAHALTMTLSHT